MKIAFDIRGIAGDKGGKGVWTMNVLKSILENDKVNEYYLYTNRAEAKGQNEDYFKHHPNVRKIFMKWQGFFWHLRLYKRLLADKIDVFIATESYIIPFLHNPRQLKVGMVVHDLVAFKSPAKHQKKATWIERLTLRKAVQKSRWIFTVSEYTRQDLLERYPDENLNEKIKVVYAGVRDVFFQKKDPNRIIQVQRRHHLDPDYLLMAGTLEPRKNIVGALKAYAHITPSNQKRYRLVIVGKKGWYYEQIFKTVQELKLKDRVIFLEYIPDEDLVPLMQGAKLFLFPSFYEGFGLPVLEAMANGIPVITSRVTSIPELGVDAVHYVDPHDFHDIARGIDRLLGEPDYCQTLIKKGHEQVKKFSWKRTAELMMEEVKF